MDFHVGGESIFGNFNPAKQSERPTVKPDGVKVDFEL
jgi:hypothetical protein